MIELLADRAERARRMLPQALRVFCCDGLTANVENESQDLVVQAVVFSSLPDDGYQKQLADRMWRWIRPSGTLLWHDFIYNNLSNREVRGVPMSRVRELFPSGSIEMHRVTLAPPYHTSSAVFILLSILFSMCCRF